MNAIVAVDENWAIGCEGKLLFDIPEDMAFFRRATQGKVVVMGRCTLESLPGGRPLKGRTNIVLSRDKGALPEGVTGCTDVQQVLEAVRAYPPEDVFVIGGQEVYTLLLEHCSRVYVTKVTAKARADRYFPNLNELPGWRVANKPETKQQGGLAYAFWEYVNTEA